MLERGERSSEPLGELGRSEVEPLQHHRHDISFIEQSSLDLAAQPITRLVTAFQRRRGKQNEKMCPRSYVCLDDLFEVTAANTHVIEEHIIAMKLQVLENRQRPRHIGSTITEKDSFLNSFHTRKPSLHQKKERPYGLPIMCRWAKGDSGHLMYAPVSRCVRAYDTLARSGGVSPRRGLLRADISTQTRTLTAPGALRSRCHSAT